MSDTRGPLFPALVRMAPTIDDLIEYLDRAGEPHTYSRTGRGDGPPESFHDHDCRACRALRALRAGTGIRA